MSKKSSTGARACAILAVLALTAGGVAIAEEVRLPVTRDTWVSSVDREAEANLGGAAQLKLKSMQEMSLVDVDPAPLRGRVIGGAKLHVRIRGTEPLRRVTVSSVGSDWGEGTSGSYAPQRGGACFRFAKYPDVPWAYPGSDITAVTLGEGGTVWASADASPPDAQGWMTIPVAPAVVAARVAGVSSGFLVFDDTGSEWTHDGERFTQKMFPNRFVFSRDGGRQNAPYLTVDVGPEDHEPPGAVSRLASAEGGLPVGEAGVSWATPADNGPAGVAGFIVDANGKRVPPYLVPRPGAAGATGVMRLRDIGFGAGQSVVVSVKAVDGAGNVGPSASVTVTTSNRVPAPLPGTDPQPFDDSGALPRLGGAELAVIDALDKVELDTGRTIPAQAPGYMAANHLWSAKQKRVRLHAGRNEFVSFQILVNGPVKDATAKLEFDGGPSPQVDVMRYAAVNTKAGRVPDPLLPVGGGFTIAPEDKRGSLLCEIYVPHDFAPGPHAGTLTLVAGGKSVRLAVDLSVWNFVLPDRLSFIPEMNCYGLPDNEADYYRLAHRNRVVINRVPYHQDGVVAPGCAPKWDGNTLDWSQWDQRFGKYFDGSAFDDLPRKGAPLDIFYLPLHENWPTPMAGNYNDSYWADQAFPPEYRKAFIECARRFAAHFNDRKWVQTRFLCFFNGKNNFKANGWSRGSSPWLLDEPAHFQDFWALRWFGLAFHDGAGAAPGPARMLFRADISRPQWQRDALDGVLDYNVVGGGAFRQYHRMVMDRKRQFGQSVLPYGSSNDPADSNVQPLAWCWDSWTLGADGVLPWQVIGNTESWKRGEDTCLFYPGGPAGLKEPVPSIRLKAYLRGEQDVEYLVLLAKMLGQTQPELGGQIREWLQFKGERKGTGAPGEDAGVIDFGSLRPQDLWRARERIGAVLSGAR